jgi:hypothetical protein
VPQWDDVTTKHCHATPMMCPIKESNCESSRQQIWPPGQSVGKYFINVLVTRTQLKIGTILIPNIGYKYHHDRILRTIEHRLLYRIQ